MQDTIFALSSGQGRSAIAVIRISGPKAPSAARDLCGCELEPRKLKLVKICDPETREVLDLALAFAFEAPASFTGEDCLELQVHGGRAVVNGVLSALRKLKGFRLAEPGEFTRRAFENNKLDLESAEGILDLINADTQLQRRQALTHLDGGVSQAADRWRERLLALRAAIEAHLDFPDEGDVPGAILAEIATELFDFECELQATLARSHVAEVLRDGFVVVIAGPPNSGKSTLLNHLVQREVAITSEIAGTTRDLIEVNLDLDGVPVVLVDTAGIREANDAVERKGIARTLRRAQNAHLVLWLDPVDVPSSEPPVELQGGTVPILRIRSKSDSMPIVAGCSAVSGLTGVGIDHLILQLTERARGDLGNQEQATIVRERHYAVLSEVVARLREAQGYLSREAPEIAADQIRSAAAHVGRLTRETGVEDVLGAIFSRFCMGK